MEYNLLGPKWGSPQLGEAGGVVYWSFATVQGDIVNFSASISGGAQRDVIRQAFQMWEDVANIDFVEVADNRDVDIRLGYEDIDGPGGTLGLAYYGYIGTGFVEAEIGFDRADIGRQTIDQFFETAIHEIGHTIGLGHSDAPNSIMLPRSYTGPVLSSGDIAGIQEIYGPRTIAEPDDNLSVLVGTPANDLMIATSQTDTFNGLEGIDTVRFEGLSDFYQITDGASADTFTVRNLTDGSLDSLSNIERLQFDNGFIAFDEFGNAGEAYRLYQAAFDRTPDPEGLGFWIENYDQGNVNLVQMAEYFMQSAEFSAAYGDPASLSDQAFLTLLYNNVLDRDPDQAGYDFWAAEQEKGISRAETIQYFSESAENVSNTTAAIDDGIWYV
ncbi:DUF4214 domain-containing protein [Sulfitobacter sp. 1A05707]|uniref:DUF4214 domain-containing protein n=1 Tax=Sulfitobacter sp. 1A05707 TaxID=3368560 RepID=UPI0037464A4B